MSPRLMASAVDHRNLYDASGHGEHLPCFELAVYFSENLACAVDCVVGIDT